MFVTLLTGRTAPKCLFQTLRGLGILKTFPVTENLIPVGSVTGAKLVVSDDRIDYNKALTVLADGLELLGDYLRGTMDFLCEGPNEIRLNKDPAGSSCGVARI